MATEDLYRGGNFNDGEDITFGDLNDAQRFLAARLFDQVLGKLIGSPTSSDPEFESQQGADPSTVWAYALTVGGGNPKQGSANNKIKIGAGTLLQKIANANGTEPQLLAYTFPGTDEVTLANGDGANPRVDMIQMALSYVTDDPQARDFQDAVTGANTSQNLNKKRRVQCVLTVKQGAAAASPVYPTPDAGNVPIACVVVGATYAGAAALKYIDTAGAVAVLHDLRMPLRVVPNRVYAERAAFDVSPLRQHCLATINSADNATGAGPVATHTRAFGYWQFAISAVPVYYVMDFLEVGDVITNWNADLRKNTNNTHTVSAKIVYFDSSGEHDAEAATSNSDNAPGVTAFGDANGPVVVAGGNQYYWKFTPSGSTTPGADEIHTVTIYYKRLGIEGAIMVRCTRPCGRLVAVAVASDLGSHAANKARLFDDVAEGTPLYLADISNATETGASPAKRRIMKMADIEAAAIFTAGPAVLGNGTHSPPIWGNGKRCYEEAMSLGAASTSPDRLGARFEFPSPAIDVYDVTFYMAEGL